MDENERKSEENSANPSGSSNAGVPTPHGSTEEVSLNTLYVVEGIKLLEEMASRGDRDAAEWLDEFARRAWKDAAEFVEPLSEAELAGWT
ncbi:MAG TPA: hypothetical protein VGX94_01930 [Terriglobia bacterium]|nr:hypothetical protein [Terriglobia bacterium]